MPLIYLCEGHGNFIIRHAIICWDIILSVWHGIWGMTFIIIIPFGVHAFSFFLFFMDDSIGKASIHWNQYPDFCDETDYFMN